MAIKEYAFDIKILATIRVKASSRVEAERLIREALDCADINAGAWANGDHIEFEGSLDGSLDLYEIDGQSV